MYLSKLCLNPLSRDVHRDISNVVGMHRTIMRGFGPIDSPEARGHHGVLHRLEINQTMGRATLLVQSVSQPNWSFLSDSYLLQEGESVKELTAWVERLASGQRWRFRLVANPTKRVSLGKPDEGQKAPKRRGPRVELREDDARRAWLLRRAEAAGFGVVEHQSGEDMRMIEHAKVFGWRGKKRTSRSIVVAPVLFEGRLEVTAPDSFRKALLSGIGPGKAYGMGLLSLAPDR